MIIENLILREIDHSQNVLAVCQHGRTRSKEIARVLDKMGYKKVQVMGIRDAFLTPSEKKNLLTQASVVVCATTTEVGDVRFFLEANEIAHVPVIINLNFSEQLHMSLAANLKGQQGSNDIETALQKHGFRQVQAIFNQVDLESSQLRSVA